MSLIKKYKYLIASLLFLFLSGVNYFLFEKDSPSVTAERYVSTVKSQIKLEIATSKNEMNDIGTLYQKATDTLFSNFEKTTQYPYYIFRNGSLIYWSDHRYIPDYQLIRQVNETALITIDNGKYIVNHLEFSHHGSKIEVFSLINLFRKFRNENDYLQTGYNSDIFAIDPQGLLSEASQGKTAYQNIKDESGKVLFSVMPPNMDSRSEIPAHTLLILSLSIFFLGVYIVGLLKTFAQKHQFGRAFFLLLGYLGLLRWLMLYYNVPYIFLDSDLFNPKFFAANALVPSLGDLLINTVIVFLLLSYIINYFYRSHLYLEILKSSENTKNIVSVVCIFLSLIVSYLCYRNLANIYEKSQYTLDFSLGITFSQLKIGSLVEYLLLAAIYFLSIHLLCSVFIRLNKSLKTAIGRWVYGLLLGLIILVFIDTFRWIYLLTGGYFLILYFAKFPRYLYSFRYRTSIYFFLGAFTFGLLAMYVIYCQEQKKDVFAKQKFGVRYLAENDLLGEGLLGKVTQSVAQDTAIQMALSRATLAREKVQQLIKSKHLDLYFDRYDTEVLAFDNQGNSLDNSDGAKNLSYYEQTYKLPKYKTQNPNVFFINDVGNDFIKEYITFISVPESTGRDGVVVLDLKLRDEFAESVYPELLMDKKLIQDPESRNYSYGIFDPSNKLIYNTGSYNYERKFSTNLLKDSELYTKGISLNEYRHVGVKGQNGRKIVVSSKDFPYRSIFSNFSFLFLISVIGIIFVIVFYIFKYGFMNMKVNYSTKIQIYLNAAFLIPLLLVVIITLSVISSTFVNTQEKTYLDNAKNIASTLQIHLENFKNKRISRPFLEQEIGSLARDTKVDINFYDQYGKLNLTTRPLIFASGLQSNLINPIAFRRIIEEKENETMLNESLGNLKYKSVYLGIKSYDGQSLGVMAIPFFDAKPALDHQVTDVVTSILSIFSVIFIILLIISYFASNILTVPLRLVTQKIKRTNLDKLNEPLEWNSDDEIGLLMGEYNKMLSKLQESKIALSQSEKQSAWREMAKQVAHEIKNPLTPMKLSIQQLQRTLPSDNPKAKERIERTLNSLTEQIDTISDIANSFSEFAKMPVPRNESFDLIPVIQKTVDLHNDQDNSIINFEVRVPELYAIGDRQFMSRVITNLILNGIQSVPRDRKPIINIKLYRDTEDNFAVLEIKDNGSGIPENYRKKVFMPNFSTKVGGSGLGLAMARRGVEHAGGSIWFDTIADEGTTFFIELPLAVMK